MLIDTHTHLYLPELRADISALMQRAEAVGVQRLYLPNIDVESMPHVLSLCDAYPLNCFPMTGLHPCSVKSDYKEQLAVLESYLSDERMIAVGEIGIDLYWDKTFLAEQLDAFAIQVDWALARNLPIVIHCRNAYHELYQALKAYAGKGLRGVFHCFSGSKEEAVKIVDLGFHLGIGGVLTYKNAGLAESIQHIPMEHLILETDSPYLTPVPHRGKPNESSYIQFVAQKLSEVRGISVAEVEEITSANALRLFQNRMNTEI